MVITRSLFFVLFLVENIFLQLKKLNYVTKQQNNIIVYSVKIKLYSTFSLTLQHIHW